MTESFVEYNVFGVKGGSVGYSVFDITKNSLRIVFLIYYKNKKLCRIQCL